MKLHFSTREAESAVAGPGSGNGVLGSRAPSFFVFARCATEASVVVRQEAAQDLVGSDQIVGAGQTQLTMGGAGQLQDAVPQVIRQTARAGPSAAGVCQSRLTALP